MREGSEHFAECGETSLERMMAGAGARFRYCTEVFESCGGGPEDDREERSVEVMKWNRGELSSGCIRVIGAQLNQAEHGKGSKSGRESERASPAEEADRSGEQEQVEQGTGAEEHGGNAGWFCQGRSQKFRGTASEFPEIATVVHDFSAAERGNNNEYGEQYPGDRDDGECSGK